MTVGVVCCEHTAGWKVEECGVTALWLGAVTSEWIGLYRVVWR